MKIKEQVLSIEQMQHLQELGVDISNASMCWLDFEDNEPMEVAVFIPKIMLGYTTCKIYPTYIIGDLIEKLPKSTDFGDLLIEFCNSDLGYGDWDCNELYGTEALQNFKNKLLKNALYDLLCWVAENHKEVLNKSN